MKKQRDNHITIFISESLQDLLRQRSQDEPIKYPLARRASIKDIIESLGIPHTEVGTIRVDGRETGFTFIPAPAQTIRVSEVAAPFDVTGPSLLRPEPLPTIRFVVDVNVGRLAALLRLAGFDVTYHDSLDDGQIADLARSENRIVLTKDRALLKRNKISFGRLVREVHPNDQLIEILRFFGLTGALKLFTRCMVCNGLLEPVEKTAVLRRLEPKTKKYFQVFKRCPDCDRIYWHGSHCDAMVTRLKDAGLMNKKEGL